ncbi:phage portal protein [Cytobacillus oceanisediminis]
MTWPFGERSLSVVSELAERTAGRSSSAGKRIPRREAMRHSAVWACLRLRADLISTMPVDVFRRVGGVHVEVTKPPIFVTPGGSTVLWNEWCYSSQIDLDSMGNSVGVITAVGGDGRPSVIELQPADEVTFIGKGSKILEYRIGQRTYEPHQIWHEKQYTFAGLPFGLSPIAHAALSLNPAMSALSFAADWFGNNTMPGGHLKNTAKKLDQPEAQKVKARFKETVQAGDVWVSGNDWEYSLIGAKASEAQFLETIKASATDVCRFLGVPGDMIDADSTSGNITYANVTQRNLQLLIMNIGPAVTRRENAWSSGLVAQPRFVKLNPGALLRMDLKGRFESYKLGIDGRHLTPDEARELENRAPLTPEQEAQFARLFQSKAATPVPAAPGGTPS